MATLDRSRAAAARRSLLRWYRLRARALPWRKSKSAYTAWVSEVMLQQTQIDTVIPYYQRFLHEFPSAERLAKAPLERVLELWSGLGYYRRARTLHQAARELVERHNGQFPRDMKQALSLPGVGDYTARAVLSIAYNQPFAVLDGNVARVMARFLALRGNLHQPRFRRSIEETFDLLLSRRSPGNFNQALMELGQTLCLPRSPRCDLCPLRKWCQGFLSHQPEDFPAPRPRRQAEEWYMAAAVLHKGRQVLLCRGLGGGLLGDLWNFPSALGQSSGEALALLKEKLRSALGARPTMKKFAHQLRHNITYRSIRVQVYTGEFTGSGPGNGFRWFQPEAVDRAAVSQLARKIARKVRGPGGNI
jgi:A/G-specific adenine glycosylase